jgi:hypothetical protein
MMAPAVRGRFAAVTAAISARRWALVLVQVLPAALLYVFFLVISLRGVDFGHHWDEEPWQLKPVQDMAASGLMMPRAAIYPSVSKWLLLAPALPSGVQAAFKPGATPRTVQAAILAALKTPHYLLAARTLFIAVSGLAILWTYGAAWALRRRWWEALLAAACVGLSWEYGYHARWVATDCILAQWAALTLFLVALYHRRGRPLWLWAAAVAAGLGTGTKYPGVLLLLPVLLSSVLALPLRPLRPQLARAAALCAVAFVAYLVTTPATVFDPFAFIEQLNYISAPYKKGYYGYGVPTHLEHARLVIAYFALHFLSPYRWLSFLLFAFAVAGAALWLRRERAVPAVVLIFPVAFVGFFCSQYLTLMVRNYLLVAPFLGLFVARGIAEALARVPLAWGRRALGTALAVVLVAQAAWLVRAAEGIRHFDLSTYAREAVAHVAAHPGQRFRLSAMVRALAEQQHLSLPPNVTTGPADAVVFFGDAEGPGVWQWKSNDPFMTEAVFGTREVNFDWYTSWQGHDRIVVMTTAKAARTGVPLASK